MSPEDDNLQVEVDIWLSLVFVQGKKEYVKKQSEYFNVCMHHGPV